MLRQNTAGERTRLLRPQTRDAHSEFTREALPPQRLGQARQTSAPPEHVTEVRSRPSR